MLLNGWVTTTEMKNPKTSRSGRRGKISYNTVDKCSLQLKGAFRVLHENGKKSYKIWEI